MWNGDEADSSRQTMYNLIGLGTINPDNPASSTLLTKPLPEGLEVSTDAGTVTGTWHGGGTKFASSEDEDFRTTLAWVWAYTQCLAEE